MGIYKIRQLNPSLKKFARKNGPNLKKIDYLYNRIGVTFTL